MIVCIAKTDFFGARGKASGSIAQSDQGTASHPVTTRRDWDEVTSNHVIKRPLYGHFVDRLSIKALISSSFLGNREIGRCLLCEIGPAWLTPLFVFTLIINNKGNSM